MLIKGFQFLNGFGAGKIFGTRIFAKKLLVSYRPKFPNMLIFRTLNCWIQGGFTKIPRMIILVAWRSDLNLRRYGDLQS